MKLRIEFDKNGKSSQVRKDSSLFRIVDGVKVPITGDPDIYEVPDGPLGQYIKEPDGSVRPLSAKEVFDLKPYGDKRRLEYHSVSDQLDAIFKTFQSDPAFVGTPLGEEIAHWQSVKAKYPKK